MKQYVFLWILIHLFTTIPFLKVFSQPKKVELSNRVSVEFPGQFQRLQIQSITIYQFKDSTGTYRATVSDIEAAGIYAPELKEEMSKTAFWDDYIEVLMSKQERELKLTHKKLKPINGIEVMELIFGSLVEAEASEEKTNIAVYCLIEGSLLIEIMYLNDGAPTGSISKQKFLTSLQIKQNP